MKRLKPGTVHRGRYSGNLFMVQKQGTECLLVLLFAAVAFSSLAESLGLESTVVGQDDIESEDHNEDSESERHEIEVSLASELHLETLHLGEHVHGLSSLICLLVAEHFVGGLIEKEGKHEKDDSQGNARYLQQVLNERARNAVQIRRQQ